MIILSPNKANLVKEEKIKKKKRKRATKYLQVGGSASSLTSFLHSASRFLFLLCNKNFTVPHSHWSKNQNQTKTKQNK